MNIVGQAQALTRAQRYQEAIDLLRPAHRADPAQPLLAEALGLAYLGIRDVNEAAEVLTACSTRGGDSAGLRCAWGMVAWRRGNYPQARTQYEAALLQDPTCPAALLGLGRWYGYQKEDALAARYLETAWGRGAGRDAAVYLAEVRTRMGDHGAAVAALRMAALAPRPLLADFEGDAIAMRLADAELLDEDRRHEAAARQAGRPAWVLGAGLAALVVMLFSVPALAGSANAATHLAHGKERLGVHDYVGCISEMQAALFWRGTSAKAWAYEGVCYELHDELDRAAAALREAYDLDPQVMLDGPRDAPWDRIRRLWAQAAS